ncbi:MAG TPA: presenilin family intramembrane aspartyl protease [Candidatus Nanoarchaeia archaeon]|nr:presenilin family intramembrane aspartyl protease [Candidatus Nanoarchaeia archaeon]
MKHNLKITLLLVSIFFLAQLIGLLIIQNYIDVQKSAETGQTAFEQLPLGIERPPVTADYSFIYITIAVLIGTVLLLLMMKFQLQLLWKVWYAFAITIALTIALNAFIPTTAAVIVSIAIAAWKVLRPNPIIHNLSELFIYGGLAVIFVPIMNIFSATMLLLLISIYDMYAVWKSKHMITLAKFQSKANIFAGFYVPYSLKTAHMPKAPKATKTDDAKADKIKSAVLGGGDIAFPLLFTGTVFTQLGFIPTIIIPITTALALLALLIKGKKNTFYPAMPFLTIGCLVGYGIILLF